MRKVKLARIASPISWWNDCIGQVCPVIDVYEKTGYIRIKVMRTEQGFEPYAIEGWIDPIYVDVIE